MLHHAASTADQQVFFDGNQRNTLVLDSLKLVHCFSYITPSYAIPCRSLECHYPGATPLCTALSCHYPERPPSHVRLPGTTPSRALLPRAYSTVRHTPAHTSVQFPIVPLPHATPAHLSNVLNAHQSLVRMPPLTQHR
eukprot:Phypoly_transcript_16387.p1 GENE.Phypoly_transcript_16387~~Phypoly_transcript_16387.p1  ORF type:complete len:138 (-),score=18.91 Phypoly_transcript_16387:277-690(-)